MARAVSARTRARASFGATRFYATFTGRWLRQVEALPRVHSGSGEPPGRTAWRRRHGRITAGSSRTPKAGGAGSRLSAALRLLGDPRGLSARVLVHPDAGRPAPARRDLLRAHVRDHRRLPPLLRAQVVQDQPGLPVRAGRAGRDGDPEGPALVGRPPPHPPQVRGPARRRRALAPGRLLALAPGLDLRRSLGRDARSTRSRTSRASPSWSG